MKEARQDDLPQHNNSGRTGINEGEQKLGRANQDDTYDISHMDRQEGTMNHGTLGGNFECAEDKEHDAAVRNEDTNK